MVRSPVEICLGTSPSQAAKSRPLVNTSPAPIAATIALEMIGPMPGTLISLPHPVQRLQVELIGGLRRHELHRRPLYRLGDCLGIAEVVLLSLRIGTNILRWHKPGVVAKAIELAAEMMRPDASFHADQAWRHVGKTCFYLATRPLLTQHNRSALILANNMEPVLADIDADHGDRCFECLSHLRSLSLVPLASIKRWRGRSTAGPSHYRTSTATKIFHSNVPDIPNVGSR